MLLGLSSVHIDTVVKNCEAFFKHQKSLTHLLLPQLETVIAAWLKQAHASSSSVVGAIVKEKA
jgi:hypothetical protein